MRTTLGLLAVLAFLITTHLAQHDLLWVEEGYPTAAAQQILAGKTLYRDIWFDKPPLFPAIYLLWGAHTGTALRIGQSLYLFAACLALYFAVNSRKEGLAAAALLAFFLTFGFPSAVMALAPDLLLILPHALAIAFAIRGRPFLSGLAAGIGILVNTKAVFVLAACAIWQWRALPLLLAGFALPNAVAALWMWTAGSLTSYWQQVWQWGFLYSRDTFIDSPLKEGAVRTGGWLWFQSAAVVGAACAIWRQRDWRWLASIAICAVGVAAGWRFFPRYYFLLLVPVCYLSGWAFIHSRIVRVSMAALLLIPAIRFGPRLLNHDHWSDLEMMDDSRAASAILDAQKKPGDTLLVWGYRPDIFAFSNIPAGTRFLDSQPLTGVIADRHLVSSQPAAPELAATNRAALTNYQPTWIVDGLGPYNKSLAITNYSDLHTWLNQYQEVAHTKGTTIYRKK